MKAKQTTFLLDGVSYPLKFTMRVPMLWEEATGKNYFACFGSGAKPGLTDILTLVWAAFKNGGASLTLEELADRLSDKDLADLSTAVLKLASDNSSPAPEGDKAPLAAPQA